MSEQSDEVRTCGRPTRSGAPCKARIYGADVACRTHITPHERELAESYRRGYDDGFQRGSRMSAGVQEGTMERLQQRVNELEQQLDDATRVYSIGRDQVVEVDGYAYRWRGDSPLVVGDRVLVPENWLSRVKRGPGPIEGTVTKLGSTYKGELSLIVRRLPLPTSKDERSDTGD